MDFRIFTEPQLGASYDQQLAAARTSEAAGFDAYFRSDHYLTMGGSDGLPGPTDSWVTLAGLARETSTIRLGTMMTSATFRHPGPLAISVAEVDVMSGGRIELGLGAGWYEAEHRAYAIPFPDVVERFDRFEEQLAIITGLWQTPVGQTFSFTGKQYSVTDSPGLPKPAQHPRPPIIIGGSGKRRTPALTARYADEYNGNFVTPETLAAQYAGVRDACATIGRDPASLRWSLANTVCCGRDDAELRRRVAAINRDVDDLRANAIAGTPAEVVDRIGQYAAAGADRFYLQVLDFDDLDHIELLADAVVSQLR